jgi:hypothetical protein
MRWPPFGSDTAWSEAATRSTPLAAHRCSTRPRPTCAETARCQPPSRSNGGGSLPFPAPPTSPRNQARLIDTKLAIPLLNLPPTVVKDPMVSLAQRNLIRGKRLGLPAGQDIAKMMKMKPLSNTELGLPDPGNPGWAGKAPLWFYILREAEIRQGGRRLGPLGAKLVAEVIVGILSCDKSSYIYDKTPFQPAPPIAPGGKFTMGEFAAFAKGI